MNFLGADRLAALRTDGHWIEHLSAQFVLMKLRATAFIQHVDVAPMHITG
jgi:hypothetical protein